MSERTMTIDEDISTECWAQEILDDGCWGTCLLPDGHRGEHIYTPDAEFTIVIEQEGGDAR